MGQDLVLRDEGGRGVLVDHHPRVDARRCGEERRQPAVEPRIDQQRRPPLADRAQLGDGDLGEVERQRDRLAVEVAAADDPPAAGRDGVLTGDAAAREDERVVGRGVELDVEDAAQVVERVADRAMDLRRAAQRVGILDLVGVAVMAGLQATVAEQMPKLGGDPDLARVRTRQLVGRRERDVGAEQGLHAHRRDDARGPRQAVRVGQQERPDRAHHLGPVEEGEALLRLEGQRLQTGLAQRDQGRHDDAAELDLAATDERERQVGERGEIARRADAALLRHDRVDPAAEEVEEAIDDQRPAAAVAEGEGVRAEQEHRPDDLAREGRPDAGGVAHQDVLLEPGRIRRRDEGRGQVAEPGRHAVHDGSLGDERFDDVARLLHPPAGIVVELDPGTVARDQLDLGDRQVGAGQDDGRTAGRASAVRVEARDLRLTHCPRIVGYAPAALDRSWSMRSACSRSSTDRHPVPEQTCTARSATSGVMLAMAIESRDDADSPRS